MSLTTFSDIPRSILALLLDGVGKAQGISPRLLMGEPGTIGPQERAQLYAGGFIEIPDKPKVKLTSRFVNVARVLLNPHTNINIRIWGKDNTCGETNIQFPGDIMQGNGVILNQMGRMYRICAFVDDSTIVKMVGEAMPDPKEQNIEFDFKAHLDNTVAAILFAVVDLARARAAKKTEPVLNMVFNTQDIHGYMFDLWTLTGFKNLITYITAVGIMTESPSLADTVDGLRLLTKAGLLKEIRRDSYSLAKAVEPLVRLTVGQPSGIQWQRVSLLDNGETLVSNRLFLFGDKSLMLCLAPTVKGRIYISRVRRKEITDFLAEEMMATLTPISERLTPPATLTEPVPSPEFVSPAATHSHPTATPPPAASLAHQAAPTPPVRPPAPTAARPSPLPVQPGRTAARPVQPVRPPRPVTPPVQPGATLACASCGAPIAPNKKFCANCGTPVTSGRAAPVAPASCANCGTIIKPGTKFCKNCGAAITAGQTQTGPAKCPNCGQGLKPGAKFCPGCGTRI